MDEVDWGDMLGYHRIFGNQLLFTLGLNFTSPAYAAALQPAIPVFTFLLALAFGTENANWQRIDGKEKILRVLVCVAGAPIMPLYKGPALLGDGFSDLNLQGIAVAGKPAPEPIGWLATLLVDAGVKLWHLGVVCLVGNCFVMASYIVYQAPPCPEPKFKLSPEVREAFPVTPKSEKAIGLRSWKCLCSVMTFHRVIS
ncbi:unnamed protein product [Sphagnum jensenii]|uniref:WAT1-related protein n=1 Tax=Sphagnum jensenii TaxID=128206 RepID=A0ABP1BSI8_9BRYO